MRGAYFCMGAYKRDVVVVIEMVAYIHGVLILCGCLFTVNILQSNVHSSHKINTQNTCT